MNDRQTVPRSWLTQLAKKLAFTSSFISAERLAMVTRQLSASDDSDDGVEEEGKGGASVSVSVVPSWTELVPGYKHGSRGEQAAGAGKNDEDDSDDDGVGIGSVDVAGKGLQAEKVAAVTNSSFPDVDNLDASIRYLNQMLVVYGFPSPLDLTPTPADNAAVAKTCNCLYALLQQRQRDIGFRDSMNEQRQRLMSATSRLEAKVERLETQLSSKDRELTTMTLEKQKMAAAHRVQVEKLQAERDEFQRMSIGMQQLRVQQAHEIRKKEKEYTKLQERLNQVVMEKKKESKAGMDIVNMLQKEGRQRGTWSGKKADSDFYKMIVDSYEAKKQELLVENADLRASLRSLQADMRELLNSQGHVKGEANHMGAGVMMTPCETPLRGRTDIFDLPYHLTRDEIENSMRAKIASIRERMEHLQSAQSMAAERETATQRELDLEAQLLEARSLIQEQESIIEMSISIGDTPGHSERMNMELQQEAALSAMEEDRALLEERKRQLESERAAYESMALQLDEERRKLGRERRKLEEEQRAWQTSLQLWGDANVPSLQEDGHHHILGASDVDISHSKLKQNGADRLSQEEKFRLPIPPLGDTV
ncbi:hypothetical protein CBR_g34541 [Chara braunii]|uniref:Uncharacterized protein n=1 Tax=Chara braunii TaxID=69332 RepID=A0A388LIW8_CHABU|nr:hypothetical protein CBR_g34541 [Chara braunii]|eukprot:GBG82258.1 hypothetical protein CBR_g34541 [Chara braunii]